MGMVDAAAHEQARAVDVEVVAGRCRRSSPSAALKSSWGRLSVEKRVAVDPNIDFFIP
jgi:hypothetical protein